MSSMGPGTVGGTGLGCLGGVLHSPRAFLVTSYRAGWLRYHQKCLMSHPFPDKQAWILDFLGG